MILIIRMIIIIIWSVSIVCYFTSLSECCIRCIFWMVWGRNLLIILLWQQATVFAFAMKAMKMKLPMISGLTSTRMTCIMSDGVHPTPDHLFLQNVSRISFVCYKAVELLVAHFLFMLLYKTVSFCDRGCLLSKLRWTLWSLRDSGTLEFLPFLVFSSYFF